VLELNYARCRENGRPNSRTQDDPGQGTPARAVPAIRSLYKLFAVVARNENSLLVGPGILTRKSCNRAGHMEILVHPECNVDILFG
jgi:hypothetical protein